MTRVDRLLIAAAALAVLTALITVVTGGLDTSIGGVRFSSRSVRRPLAVAVAALALAVRRSARREQQVARFWQVLQRRAAVIGMTAAAVTLALGVRFGIDAAGGADYYGYVSQASLWLKGDLRVPQPLSAEAPWPDAAWSFAPLGYRPGPIDGTIVPTYSPGLPMAMAALQSLDGASAVYVVVPIFGALAVWLTFVLGRELDDAATGALGALLLATSPVFLFHVMVPMSDVPVTAWWMLAVTLAFGTTAWTALGSGLAVSAALLTRPNLLPLAFVVGAWFGADARRTRRDRARAAAAFATGVVPGCVAVAAINAWLYGSPLESGYGRIDTIFALDRFLTNMSRYPGWMLETQTPFIFLGLAAPWITGRLLRNAEHVSRIVKRRQQWLLLTLSGVLFACYAFYLPFDNWTFLRFLMPSIPPLLILSVIAARAIIGRAAPQWQPLLTMGIVGIVAAACWDTAIARHVLVMREPERRFPQVAAFVRESLPPNAVVLSRLHSGSVRQYADRLTVRWDSLPPEWFDRALAFLRDRGYAPYLLIEESEEAEYKARFAGHSGLATIDWNPVMTREGPPWARIFDLTPASNLRR